MGHPGKCFKEQSDPPRPSPLGMTASAADGANIFPRRWEIPLVVLFEGFFYFTLVLRVCSVFISCRHERTSPEMFGCRWEGAQ